MYIILSIVLTTNVLTVSQTSWQKYQNNTVSQILFMYKRPDSGLLRVSQKSWQFRNSPDKNYQIIGVRAFEKVVYPYPNDFWPSWARIRLQSVYCIQNFCLPIFFEILILISTLTESEMTKKRHLNIIYKFIKVLGLTVRHRLSFSRSYHNMIRILHLKRNDCFTR
jgi:hypothetical protein